NGNEAEGFMLNVMRGPRDYTEDLDRRVLQLDFDDQQTRWVSGLDFAYTPTSALDMKLTLGFDYADQENVMNAPFGGWWVPLGERAARRYRVETRTIDFRTTYRAELGGVASSTSTGFEVFDEQFKDVFGLSTTFAGPHDPTLTSGAIRDVVENQFREVNAGFFVQEQLGFADRYFLTAGVRVDGNSAFGDDFGLQAYPKLSASYVISDEAFWPDFFEMTKLRAAYGESGKAPGFFDAEKVWSPVRAKEDEAGVTPENPGNPGLGPERSREIEAGIEASTLEGRVGVDFTYYYQRTSDALIPVTLDPTLGFQGSQLRNVGTLDNWGVEFALDTEPVRTRNISWSLGFILSTNKSEVKDLGGSPPIFRGRSIWVREGYPVASIFAEKVLNPNEIAEPILAEDPDPNFGNNVFLGPVFPETNYSVNTQLRLGDNLRISSRGEFKGGGNQWSAVSNFNTTRTVWPPCFDAQVAMEAGDLSQVTALERARCRDFRRGTHVYGTDFFRLR
ncbi:MAG: TonB-dependent receptor, partial [Gemmatimonadetes bacterium]|nr:TonB-dependent receptor [Gemmatimonadota bacterium]NIT87934.1 TonB-dependent receptor [Gemmatimonadota bacterium]NIU31790.1 TonB-dependent receptor [Gemmatimonadota bacterium]NIU36403.1 TonB-dependent receptor [Gemmatimonadota bacterium]NIV83314.1 TonB-dependent receptor [Gemmatimonadota bacterium]